MKCPKVVFSVTSFLGRVHYNIIIWCECASLTYKGQMFLHLSFVRFTNCYLNRLFVLQNYPDNIYIFVLQYLFTFVGFKSKVGIFPSLCTKFDFVSYSLILYGFCNYSKDMWWNIFCYINTMPLTSFRYIELLKVSSLGLIFQHLIWYICKQEN